MRLTKLHLKRLIQEELEKAAEETKSDSKKSRGPATLKDSEAEEFADLVKHAYEDLKEAFKILDDAGIIGTLKDDVKRAKEQTNSLWGQVASKFGSGFNPYSEEDPLPSKRTPQEREDWLKSIRDTKR
jgi:hypothetical protein